MGTLGDRFASIDERYAVRRTQADGLRQSRKGAAWALAVVAVVVISVARVLLDGLVASLVVLAAALAFLVWYVIWRRARNRRMTGSPTTWPTADGA